MRVFVSALRFLCGVFQVQYPFANISKGNRPSFIDAEEPNIANKVIKYVAQELSQYGNVKEGIFGEDMNVSIDNDGPITIILESKNGKLKS